ncbi:MAG: HAMP domain-containing histidine kinase [Candidatus Hydrogenedentes bacterium]|nr:HAMP domain-containing histidine kinase [Candidatus Hydrogenedentota bacterium]
MRRRLLITLLVIVVAPLAVLAWLGVQLVRDEREMVRHRFREIIAAKLGDVAGLVDAQVAARERELMAGEGLSMLSPDELRARAFRSGLVRQFFVLDATGELVYPAPDAPATEAERDFLLRTREVWINKAIPGPAGEQRARAMPQQAAQSKMAQQAAFPPAPALPGKGWHTWYWSNGLNLIFWWRDDADAVVGAELNRARFIADVLAALPDTPGIEGAAPVEERIALLDAQGAGLYQWGVYEPAGADEPVVEVRLNPPLSAWRLTYYAPDAAIEGAFQRTTWFGLGLGLAVLAAALIGLATYFYRESARDMREAAQRVSFVNQVSHELKTPLTNIRMYAEMLDDELGGDEEEPARARLHVIVSESRRLSRLIGNVLTFGRRQRSALTPHRTRGNVDAVVRAVIDQFDENLGRHGVAAHFTAGAARDAEFDQDVLAQIVGNLLSNVEKYALSGDRVDVETRQEGDTVTVCVADSGPGIPAEHRARVFEPFYRVSNRVNDGVAGTGIGLAIARDLARLHGGDLVLESGGGGGARFTLRIHARPMMEDDHESAGG